MTFGQTRIPGFQSFLADNGIPVDAVQLDGAAPAGVTVQYGAAATAEQKAWAEDAKANYDWRRRVPIDRNTVASTLAGLTTAQRNAVVTHVVADWLRTNTSEASSIAAVLGAALPVDQADPTENPS